MGAFATIRMPVDATNVRGGDAVVHEIATSLAGTRNVVYRDGMLAFELSFPGALGSLVDRLAARGIVAGPNAEVSVPVTHLVDEPLDPEAVRERLLASPQAWDVPTKLHRWVLDGSYASGRIEATVVASTQSMLDLYNAMLKLALVAREPGIPSGA